MPNIGPRLYIEAMILSVFLSVALLLFIVIECSSSSIKSSEVSITLLPFESVLYIADVGVK